MLTLPDMPLAAENWRVQKMSKSLMAAHKDLENEKLKNELYKKIESEVVPRVQLVYLLATTTVLHDKFGFGEKRMNDYINHFFDIFDSIDKKYVDFEDLKKCVNDELGIDFDEIESERVN